MNIWKGQVQVIPLIPLIRCWGWPPGSIFRWFNVNMHVDQLWEIPEQFILYLWAMWCPRVTVRSPSTHMSISMWYAVPILRERQRSTFMTSGIFSAISVTLAQSPGSTASSNSSPTRPYLFRKRYKGWTLRRSGPQDRPRSQIRRRLSGQWKFL